MNIFICITLLLTIACCLWTTEGRKKYRPVVRKYVSVLTVPNGGPWGEWGKIDFCRWGHVWGFQLRVSTSQHNKDEEGLTGIALFCPDGEHIHSSYSYSHGGWNRRHSCPSDKLVAFSLKVQPYQGTGDDTAANNIQFKCSDGTIRVGDGQNYGDFGPWSDTCPEGSFVCGIQTKFEAFQWTGGDDTAINDVKLYCC